MSWHWSAMAAVDAIDSRAIINNLFISLFLLGAELLSSEVVI